jgi:long-chain fatty acid transport protein
MLRALAVVSAVLFAATNAAPARASGFDLYGVGSRAGAMGMTGAASSRDYTAIIYNPAAMTNGPSSAGGGLSLTLSDVAIRLGDRPPGYEIPDLGAGSPAVGEEYRLRARGDFEGFDPTISLYAGGTTDLGFERLRLGFMMYLNLKSSGDTQSYFVDEREQFSSNTLHFDVIGGRVDHIALYFSGAYAITDWFSLGIGASYMPASDINNIGYLDNLTDQENIDLNVDLQLGARFRPMLGVLFTPAEGVRLGASFRDEQFLALAGVTEIQVRGLQGGDDFPFYQDLDIVLQYSPRQILWGASYDDERWRVSADLVLSFWSDYVTNHNEPAGFDDVFSPRVGAELSFLEHHDIRLGAAWEPSPVPAQPGRTNHVDNDRVVGSLGMGHHFELGDSVLEIAWHAQLHVLVERTELKSVPTEYVACAPGVTTICDEVPDDAIDPTTGAPYVGSAGLQTGNPGFPGYTSGGWLLNTGVEVSWHF